jgi:hypothetical protein
MTNDMCGLITPMPLRSAYQEAFKECKYELKKILNSFDMFSAEAGIRIMTWLPFTLPYYSLCDNTSKFTILFSNANMSKKQFSFDGKKNNGHFYFGSAGGVSNTIFNLCTIGPITSVSCYADEHSIKYPKEFVDIFMKKNEEALEGQMKNK